MGHFDKVMALCQFGVYNISGKGVFTNKAFRAGEFLLEYPGELISKEEA